MDGGGGHEEGGKKERSPDYEPPKKQRKQVTEAERLLAAEIGSHQSSSSKGRCSAKYNSGDFKIECADRLKLEESTSANSEEVSHVASSSSNSNDQIIESLQRDLRDTKVQLANVLQKHNDLLKDLRDSVECPVCFNVPRTPPIPCCRNGHFICQRCKSKCDNSLCPTCRTSKTDCVSQIAGVIIQKIDHACEFRDEGCSFRGEVGSMALHEENCCYRLVRCPHWACDEMVTARNLTHHVIAAECGDSYRDKPLPYREEMVYTQALDDEEGNGFWKPSLLQFDGITFYLQVEKCGKSKNWYFYIQMEGSPADCQKYGTMIKVSKNLETDRNSIIYNGVVSSIDVKGANELEASGAGLNIRDAAMEKIFDVNLEEGGEEEDKGFKFWVDVDIYKVSG